MTAKTVWSLRMTRRADADFQEIIRWTAAQFGEPQARAYVETLSTAIDGLAKGPTVVGAQKRDDVLPGLIIVHIRRRARKGRHLIVFRVADSAQKVIDVLRILHDAMDLPRHVQPHSTSD